MPSELLAKTTFIFLYFFVTKNETSQNTTVFIDVNAPEPKFGRTEKSQKTAKKRLRVDTEHLEVPPQGPKMEPT